MSEVTLHPATVEAWVNTGPDAAVEEWIETRTVVVEDWVNPRTAAVEEWIPSEAAQVVGDCGVNLQEGHHHDVPLSVPDHVGADDSPLSEEVGRFAPKLGEATEPDARNLLVGRGGIESFHWELEHDEPVLHDDSSTSAGAATPTGTTVEAGTRVRAETGPEGADDSPAPSGAAEAGDPA